MNKLVDINGKSLVTYEYDIELTLKTTVRVLATSIAEAEIMADDIGMYQVLTEDGLVLSVDSLEITP